MGQSALLDWRSKLSKRENGDSNGHEESDR